MQQLTIQGQQAVQNIARRYNLSVEAVTSLLGSVYAGGGTMAQFYVPELGGNGQWMQGGMTMVGDMFNAGLQNTVANLCAELSNLLNNQQVYLPVAPGAGGWQNQNWWPAELGQPSSSGGQNDSQYAIFPDMRRLAVKENGQVAVYDTLDHSIGGVQQQSGNFQPLSFSSQYGTFVVNSLPVANNGVGGSEPFQESKPAFNNPPPVVDLPVNSNNGLAALSTDEIFRALEQLGQLNQKGIITSAEFETKKADLLARL